MDTKSGVEIRANSTIKLKMPSGMTTDWTYLKGAPVEQMLKEVAGSVGLKVVPLEGTEDNLSDSVKKVPSAQRRSDFIMSFVNQIISAYEFGFTPYPYMTLQQLHRMAQQHVKDEFGIDAEDFEKAFGAELFAKCKAISKYWDKPAVAVPDGWKLVPAEVDRDTALSMIMAAAKANGLSTEHKPTEQEIENSWKFANAVLAAAPSTAKPIAQSVPLATVMDLRAYMDEFGKDADLNVIRSELGEMIQRANGTYDNSQIHDKNTQDTPKA